MRRVQTICLYALILGLMSGGTLFAQDIKSTPDNTGQSSTTYRRDSSQTADRDRTMERTSDQEAETPRASMQVSAGTEVVVRTNEAIDSTSAEERQTYSGVVENAVFDADGRTLIPRGSDARLVVRKANTGGTTSSPEVILGLDSITIRGHRYEVNSADLEQGGNKGIGKNRRTGEYVGGGAALGTLLGAIAGGGKGAAIGAVAGAAAGGTTQVLTKGKEVKIPAETTLRFRLDQPLSLRARD
jgi:hypothetical protein